MDALEVLRKRRSVRKYLKKPVSRSDIETMVDCGRMAATARNEQPWEFIVVTEAKMRKTLADITEYGKFIADAPVCICVFCKDTKYYIEDGSAATENLLLAARALGLGTCWVAGDKKPYAEKVAQILGVPAGFRLMSFVSVGYAEDPDPNCVKRPLGELIHWEKF